MSAPADGAAAAESPAEPTTGLLAELTTELTAALGSRSDARREARWIVEDAADAGNARAWAQRRAAGEPLQYVLGHWAFRRLDLSVDERALIARPETEQVVQVALDELRARCGGPAGAGVGGGAGPGGGRPVLAVDLGTGSGAIALSLADELAGELPGVIACGVHVPGIEVWATDRSDDALALARANAARVGAGGYVRFAAGDWWDALPVDLAGRVDLVVSNPPYVSAAEWPDLDPVVRDHEPRSALVADDGRDGTPGLACVEAVLEGSPRWLAPGGAVVVELAPSQARAALAVASSVGLVDARIERDLAGRDRAVVAHAPHAAPAAPVDAGVS